MSIYRRVARYFTDFKKQTALAILLTLLAVGLNLLKPWPVKIIIDNVLAPGQGGDPDAVDRMMERWMAGWSPQTIIAVLCATLVLVFLLWGIVNLFANYLFVKTGLKGLLKLRTEIYSCLQSLPLKFHDSRRSSDSSFRVAYDTQSVQTIYNRGLSGITNSSAMLVGVFIVMLSMDWQLTLVSLAVLPFVVLTIRFYALRIRQQSTAIHEKESAVLDVAQEGLRSVRLVHAFTQEEYEIGQFKKQAENSLEANLKFNVTSVASTLVTGTLMAIGTAAMYWIGSNHVLDGTLKLGDLIVFAAYLAMLYGPLESLTYTAWALEGAAAGAQRCFEVLDSEDDVADKPDAVPIGKVDGKISFKNVTFGYSPQEPVLKDVSFEIAPGRTTAIVGGTGEGKSTLLSLIPRFYLADGGRILIDGKDVCDVTRQSLRSQIGMVLQDTLLFSTSVRENIQYGRPDAGEEEIIEAAKRAQAHDFISQMSEGYSSQVGERGAFLSVGQRQRIGIARAFLKNAPILLLDEPTSALDPTTEKSIMETIEELMAGRTALIVTHRIHTVHHADEILVMRDGTIAERGRGAALLKSGGHYARLYQHSDSRENSANE